MKNTDSTCTRKYRLLSSLVVGRGNALVLTWHSAAPGAPPAPLYCPSKVQPSLYWPWKCSLGCSTNLADRVPASGGWLGVCEGNKDCGPPVSQHYSLIPDTTWSCLSTHAKTLRHIQTCVTKVFACLQFDGYCTNAHYTLTVTKNDGFHQLVVENDVDMTPWSSRPCELELIFPVGNRVIAF